MFDRQAFSGLACLTTAALLTLATDYPLPRVTPPAGGRHPLATPAPIRERVLGSRSELTPRRAKSGTRPSYRQVVATAYCLGPCGTCETTGLTSTGTRGSRGAAVARRSFRRVLPLGSRLLVPGYGLARVDDIGGGVRSNQIDLRFRSHGQAKRWGKRRVTVAVVPRP